MSQLELINGNHYITIQDLGRFKGTKFGLTHGGAVDLPAYCWGQKLLGNPINAASLEILFGRAKFRAKAAMTLVLTGADCRAKVFPTNRSIRSWVPFKLHPDDELHLSIPRHGCRSYLSVKGGFTAPSFLESVSTVEREGIGGLMSGQPLKLGDELDVFSEVEANLLEPTTMPQSMIPSYQQSVTVRLLQGAQYQHFTPAFLKHLLSISFTVSPNSNRMGIRLMPNSDFTANSILSVKSSLISEGIVCGAVQVPPDGKPIIMLNDRQTLGGYPKIGTVAYRDLAKLAQIRPGDEVKLALTNLEIEKLKQQYFFRYFGL